MTSDQIKQLRSRLGLTARQLGEALGVDQKTVLDWETGQRFPTKRHVKEMLGLGEKKRDLPTAPARRPGPDAETPIDALAQPEFWTLVRKLALHQRLREELARLAADYPDAPGDRRNRSERD